MRHFRLEYILLYLHRISVFTQNLGQTLKWVLKFVPTFVPTFNFEHRNAVSSGTSNASKCLQYPWDFDFRQKVLCFESTFLHQNPHLLCGFLLYPNFLKKNRDCQRSAFLCRQARFFFALCGFRPQRRVKATSDDVLHSATLTPTLTPTAMGRNVPGWTK